MAEPDPPRDGYSYPYWESDPDDTEEEDMCPHGKGFDEQCTYCDEEPEW